MALVADLLNENFDILTSWTNVDAGYGVTEISPAGQMRQDSNTPADPATISGVYKIIATPPNLFTLDVNLKCDLVGLLYDGDRIDISYSTSTWMLKALIAADGLFLVKAGATIFEVGTNIIKTGGSAEFQKLRFQVNKSAGEANAIVEVVLDEVSQGTFDCDWEVAGTAGEIKLVTQGVTTANIVTHTDYIRIASGIGPINSSPRRQAMII